MEIFGHKTPTTELLKEALKDCNIKLRWGGPKVPGAVNGDANLLSGIEQLTTFNTAGIETVTFTTIPSTRDLWAASGHIVFGRKANHTQGFDIVYPGTESRNRRWLTRDFWVIYQPSVSEWRVHIAKDSNGVLRCIARGKKVQLPPAPNNKDFYGHETHPSGLPLIRARRLGWHLSHEASLPNGIRTLAKNAVAALQYDLGAVDILELMGHRYMVLEVNSRPAIRDSYTLNAYSKAFRRLEEAK